MLNTPATRAPTAALLALPVAYGLFLIMNSLIDVKEITVVKQPSRILDTITPQRPDPDKPTTRRVKPTIADTAPKPPPPPQISATKSTIKLPTPVIAGAAPASLVPSHLKLPNIVPVVVSSRGFQVARPPVPTYPSKAAARGLTGHCDVDFAIDPRGKPYNVSARCSDPVFKGEAERSVSKAEFVPQLVDGQFVTVKGLVFPLEFTIPK
ncbi:energy transducer TonB [Hyphomonas johnsonii]|uniref:TonB family protein n=1 Tax=Hyphomonas johnsonii MHS-2 TaxID=1280950 RepID=A0A059FR41_9PROT|nr:energy transducer TonB [Hyphomonas johnsonii]KCZ92933.1 TonB family protein [Hyphomonas johnsonii MHS-2]